MFANRWTGVVFSTRRFRKFALAALTLAFLFSAIGVVPARAATTWTVTSLADDGTINTGNCPHASACRLRDAVAAAAAGDTIVFASGLAGGVIRLASSSIAVDESMTIDGSTLSSPITLSGDTDNDGLGNVRIFYIYSSSYSSIVALKGLMFEKGTASEGGAIYNRESLSVSNSIFVDNQAGDWGGGAIKNEGTLTVAIPHLSTMSRAMMAALSVVTTARCW